MHLTDLQSESGKVLNTMVKPIVPAVKADQIAIFVALCGMWQCQRQRYLFRKIEGP